VLTATLPGLSRVEAKKETKKSRGGKRKKNSANDRCEQLGPSLVPGVCRPVLRALQPSWPASDHLRGGGHHLLPTPRGLSGPGILRLPVGAHPEHLTTERVASRLDVSPWK
jgi:hypothetical protein